jgi:hypothetical protein
MISNIYSYDFADNENYEKIMKLATESKPMQEVVAIEAVEPDQKKVRF